MTRARGTLARSVLTVPLIASGLVLTLMAGVAWASWSATSAPGGHGNATATAVDRGATPTAVATGSAITVSWAATTLSSGDPVSGYLVNRYDAATLTLHAVAAGCAGLISVLSCTENGLADGRWVYSVTPVIGTHWTGAVSPMSTAVTIDTTPPSAGSISYLDGYQPGQSVTVTVTTGTDTGSGIATRQLQRSVAAMTSGVCGTFSGFTATGPDSPTSPFVDTSVALGSCYTYRYVVTDQAGNQTIATSTSLAKIDPFAGGPPLGGAASFSILAGTGVVNTLATTVSGDLGVSPSSSIVGFPPGIVSGSTHAGDATAAAAQADLVLAYNNAAARAPDVEISGDQNGITFTPGVYHSTAAFALTGTMTLDAGGDPNAMFIFQVGAALNTAAASHVLLVNGAQAAHVFWQVLGAAGTGATSTFAGTIMAAGAITVGAGTQLIGRALSYGTITLADNAVRFTTATGPVIAIDNGPTFETKDTMPTVTGTTNAATGALVTVVVAGQRLTSSVQSDGTWSVTTATLTAGPRDVTATVRDAAGNAATASQILIIEVNPDPVLLGSAATYSVLAGTNVVGVGTSSLSGDLGVSPGTSVVGITSAMVGGTIRAGGPLAAQAQTDLMLAYNDVATRTPSSEFSGDQGGKTYHEGIHHTAAAFALTGTLTLDAQGDPNATFIIQVGAALNTTALSQVALVNGAQASHVYWAVLGAAGTGATSTFAGTIMATDAITLGAGTQLTGQALAHGTTVTLTSNTITTN